MKDANNKSRLLILGAGGHGKVVAEIASFMDKWDEISFLDDNLKLKEVNGYKVIGTIGDYRLYKDKYEYAFVAIGNNQLRLNLIEKLIEDEFKIPTLIHPFTAISKRVDIDIGTVVIAGAIINTNTSIGKGCIVNTTSSVGHDCVIKDGVHISPGVNIGGTSTIGKCSWICIGSSVINNINIGEHVVVASGSSVIKDVNDKVLVGGVPAILIKQLM